MFSVAGLTKRKRTPEKRNVYYRPRPPPTSILLSPPFLFCCCRCSSSSAQLPSCTGLKQNTILNSIIELISIDLHHCAVLWNLAWQSNCSFFFFFSRRPRTCYLVLPNMVVAARLMRLFSIPTGLPSFTEFCFDAFTAGRHGPGPRYRDFTGFCRVFTGFFSGFFLFTSVVAGTVARWKEKS